MMLENAIRKVSTQQSAIVDLRFVICELRIGSQNSKSLRPSDLQTFRPSDLQTYIYHPIP